MNRSAPQASWTSTDEKRDDCAARITQMPSPQELGVRDAAIRPIQLPLRSRKVRVAPNVRRAPRHSRAHDSSGHAFAAAMRDAAWLRGESRLGVNGSDANVQAP